MRVNEWKGFVILWVLAAVAGLGCGSPQEGPGGSSTLTTKALDTSGNITASAGI